MRGGGQTQQEAATTQTPAATRSEMKSIAHHARRFSSSSEKSAHAQDIPSVEREQQQSPELDLSSSSSSSSSCPSSRRLALHSTLLLLAALTWWSFDPSQFFSSLDASSLNQHYNPLNAFTQKTPQCLAQHLVAPTPNADLDRMYAHFDAHAYANQSLAHWQKLIQVETQSHDDQGTVQDDPEAYRHLAHFDTALRQEFPLVFQHLQLEMVNTYGYLFTWPGSDPKLKPACYMAHYDTVPIGDEADWDHPPYSGHFDGRFVWGRGSLDDKSPLAALLESTTALLQAGFTPQRTVLLSFGFDEELMKAKPEGSRPLAQHILQRYGRHGVELIVDEGGMGIATLTASHRSYALPSVSEKGYLDAQITVKAQGGHSSAPPPHTGIGVMAALVAQLEDHPHSPDLQATNPLMEWLHCLVDDPGVDEETRKLIIKAASGCACCRRNLAQHVVHQWPVWGPLMLTTQAADVIHGGIKANALPEETVLTVNHRIALHESVEQLRQHLFDTLLPVAKRFHLPLNAFDGAHLYPGEGDHHQVEAEALGLGIWIDAHGALDPAPISPVNTQSWAKFSGTIRHVFGEDLIVAPSIMPANTDTKEYHDVSSNIYRFAPVRITDFAGIHSVNERATLSSHLDMVKFYFQLIRSVHGEVEFELSGSAE